ncbi:MAG: molecular chaperone HtpG [Alphaproteobacteria bacterium]|nr:molecular chaperone HtpG [Alphaproteobacteria bacterium]
MTSNLNSQTETLNFSADVARLLNIVAGAPFTIHDVFLRELISNAADACDRLRYDAINDPALTKDNPNFRIHIYPDTDARTLTVVDNGIGMDRAELVENLGTIAKSGTAALMENMKGGADPLKLIGQFGVGFYAAYMVADKVTAVSRKAGSKETWAWESDGRTGFGIREATAEETGKLDGARGTAIILHIKDEGVEFLLDEKIRQTVQQYSDHIDVKILLNPPRDTGKGEGRPANEASALWTHPKSEVTPEQYREFYRHITHGFDEPLLTAHWHAEGAIAYTALLFIPMMRPWDLYDPGRKQSVKLYVRRVLISERMEGLVYPWMRFLRGVVDSPDLPLNISRESLQYNPVLAKIRTGITRRVLGGLEKLAKNDEPGFLAFWSQFGSALKEGLYDAHEHREQIFKVCRFFSTNGEGYTSLDEYIERMKPDQEAIYYISGENAQSLRTSPQIEGFSARRIEVLIFTDTIDDFWLPQVREYKGKPFKSVTQGDNGLAGNTEDAPESVKELAARLRDLLKADVADVRISNRLTDSPVCLIAPETGVDMHMERVLKIHQDYAGESKPVLEINPEHTLVRKLAEAGNENDFEDSARLLLDQAMIIQGRPVKNPGDFVRRMSVAMERLLS